MRIIGQNIDHLWKCIKLLLKLCNWNWIPLQINISWSTFSHFLLMLQNLTIAMNSLIVSENILTKWYNHNHNHYKFQFVRTFCFNPKKKSWFIWIRLLRICPLQLENSAKSERDKKNVRGKIKFTQVSKWLKFATFVGFSPESLAGDCL